jgi:hypothetical protein
VCVCVCWSTPLSSTQLNWHLFLTALSPPHSRPLPVFRSRPLQSHTTTHGDIKRCERSSKSLSQRRSSWQNTRHRRRSPKCGTRVHRRFRKCAAAAPNSAHTHTHRSTAFADDTPAHPQVCMCQKRPSTEVKETYKH